MNLMAPNKAEEAMEETVPHGPNFDTSGHPASDPAPASPFDSHTGPHPMDTPSARDTGRYLLSSGSRPLEGYTIKRAIGRGGFGEVYFASTDAGKEVALKLILRNHDVECRGVSQCMNLKSPNLLAIHDIKTNDEGETFVVMEYVAGPSLAQVLADHPNGLPLVEVRAWLKGLVEGVAYLHDHGIVHRDLKPANIFLEEGVVKIGDYGLSKLINPGQGSGHSESIGTCHYMAPEIASGKYHKPIDIYALGIIIHEMITGKVPFDGQTVGEVLMKHLTARPDVTRLPEPFRSIVAKALAKDPANRQAKVLELLPAEDAPKSPKIRFIGDPNSPGAAAGKVDVRAGDPIKVEEDVFKIGSEEPVFYIGPETRPPGSKFAFQQWLWKGAEARRVRRAMVQNGVRQASAESADQIVRGIASRVAQGIVKTARKERPKLPEPPPLPPGRARFAETLVSMLAAAFVSAGLVFPAAVLIFDGGVEAAKNPERLAFLFLTSLLASWALIIPNKIWEAWPASVNVRRFVMLALGLGVGAIAWETSHLLRLVLSSEPMFREGIPVFSKHDPFAPSILQFMAFFGLTFALDGGQRLTSRDRGKRFRLFQMGLASLIALVMAGITQFPIEYGVGIVTVAAIAGQVVSPWSEAAALAAKARRKFKKIA